MISLCTCHSSTQAIEPGLAKNQSWAYKSDFFYAKKTAGADATSTLRYIFDSVYL